MSTDTHWIERLGHKGDGIAAGPVFAARTLPGEVISGELVGGRIQHPRIETPSTDRVSPPCRHYKSCGGCSLQHARDSMVAEWKQSIVREALAANGLHAPIRRIHTSPPESRRRATFSGRRTKSGGIVGFHGAQSDTIVTVPNCIVITKNLRDILPVLERLVVVGASRKGEVKLTVTDTAEGLDVSVTGGHAVTSDLRSDISIAIRSAPIARLTWNGELILQNAQPVVAFDGISVPFPPGAFLQATQSGESALRLAVGEAIGAGAHRVLDLFSGAGTFALPLARAAEVHAVEGEGDLITALEAGWRHATGLKQVTTEVRDLFRRPLLPDELARYDAIVIDPPRAGAAAQIAEIARSEVPVVAHVSCNPVTFARDAAVLVGAGYEMVWLDVVDQFRWSSHTELISLFKINRS